MNSIIDNIERAVETKLERADCCIQCGHGISSRLQIAKPGIDLCEICMGGVSQIEKDFIAAEFRD